MVDPRTRELGRQVFGVVRRIVETSEEPRTDELALAAYHQLCRPGRPGQKLSATARAALRAEALTRAEMVRDPRDLGALSRLCHELTATAFARLPKKGPPGTDFASALDRTSEIAKQAVYAEARNAGSDEELLRRAVTRALKERARGRRGQRRLDVDDNDPLRGLFDLPSDGPVRLPRHDLRVHLTGSVRTRGKSGLPDLLRKAARFSEKVLRPALGEELWGMCRPVGFGDRHGRRVVVEVHSSALAHEVSMRQRELLHRLQAVPGFSQVKEVRFSVPEPRRRPR
jgi:hypothetical protein